MSTVSMEPLLPPDWHLPEKEAFLADMREAVGGEPYPGYPEQADRLHIPAGEIAYDGDGRPIFPANPNASYTVFDHSVDPSEPRPEHAFHDTGGPLPDDEANRIMWDDMEQDSRGFPLHWYGVDMVADPAIGGIIGPGYYYHPGKTLTGDLGVVARGVPAATGTNEYGVTPAVQASEEELAAGGLRLCVLMTRRSDTGQFALPGGEADEEDPDLITTALREGEEETGLHFDEAESLGSRLVADPRLTTCTETETELCAVDADTIPDQQPKGSSDAKWAGWLVVNDQLLVPRALFGSHRRMLFELVEWYQDRHDVTIMRDGRIVPNTR